MSEIVNKFISAGTNYARNAFKTAHFTCSERETIEERPILIALRLFLKFLNRNSSILLFMLRYIHHSIQFWMQIPVIYFL